METHVSEPIAVQGAGDKADGAQPLIRVWTARGPQVKLELSHSAGPLSGPPGTAHRFSQRHEV